MNYKKLSADILAATFNGLSLSYQRKLALISTILIWFVVSYAGFAVTSLIGDSQSVTDISIIALFAMMVHYISGGEFFIYKISRLLFKLTPLGVLYRQDKIILRRAKAELFDIVSNNDLSTYLHYARINPEIRSAANLQVIAHQKKGDLQEWTKNVRNLKKLANLVYQIHLVEQFLSDDERLNS